MKWIYAAPIALACAFSAPAVSAMGLPGKTSGTESLVSQTRTYVCTRDDRGWHYMRGHSRVSCRPVRPHGSSWGWRCDGPRCGWWDRRDHRWHD
jgi:hypothetical protein